MQISFQWRSKSEPFAVFILDYLYSVEQSNDAAVIVSECAYRSFQAHAMLYVGASF